MEQTSASLEVSLEARFSPKNITLQLCWLFIEKSTLKELKNQNIVKVIIVAGSVFLLRITLILLLRFVQKITLKYAIEMNFAFIWAQYEEF